MIDWWSSLLLEKQIFYAIGLASISILALQILLTIGIDSHHDAELTHGEHGSGLSFLSIRTITAFFVGFGWAGVIILNHGHSVFAGAQNMLITEQLPNLVHEQVSAISNLKIDKVTVWDSGRNGDGKTGTADFLSGLIGALPPLHELARNAGLDLPTYLGELQQEAERRQSGGNESVDTGEKRVPASKSNG